MRGREKQKNTAKTKGEITMFGKIRGIFKGREAGGIGLGIAIVIAIVIIVTPPVIRVLTQAPRQFGAANTVSMDESVSMDQAQEAARDGMKQTMENAADVVKNATPPTSAQDLAIGHVLDTAVAISTAGTKTTTDTGPKVTGEDLQENTEVCPADDDAANGIGDGSGGGYSGGCNDGCGR
jgi:hypothetical protein